MAETLNRRFKRGKAPKNRRGEKGDGKREREKESERAFSFPFRFKGGAEFH